MPVEGGALGGKRGRSDVGAERGGRPLPSPPLLHLPARQSGIPKVLPPRGAPVHSPADQSAQAVAAVVPRRAACPRH